MRKMHRSFRQLLLISLLCLVTVTAAADQYIVGQKVEVREGDTWSPASILAHEGRKYQIHYTGDSATDDEWVTTDRIRLPGSAAAANAANPDTAPNPPADKYNGFHVDDNVEVKWAGIWRKALVVKQANGWEMVRYVPGSSLEWIQPWRARAQGASNDLPYVTPRAAVAKIEPPPDQAPNPAPAEPHVAGATPLPTAPRRPSDIKGSGTLYDVRHNGDMTPL